MNKYSRQLFLLLPDMLKVNIFRKTFAFPEDLHSNQVTIEVAQTVEELEKAYQLLHDSYVATKLMKPHATGLRCNVYTFLPHTTTVIAKLNGEVVGTLNLIKDSEFGLPSDHDYAAENNRLRRMGHSLTEVSGLAVDKKHRRRNHSISLMMMKYLCHYSLNFQKSDVLVCTVHPRAQFFYEGLWGGVRNGEITRYQFVEGALAIHMSISIEPERSAQISNIFKSQNPKNNIIEFINSPDSRMIFPAQQEGQILNPTFNSEKLAHFLLSKFKFIRELTAKELLYLQSVYKDVLPDHVLEKWNSKTNSRSPSNRDKRRNFRLPVRLHARIHAGTTISHTEIYDITSSGCFIKVEQTGISKKIGNSLDISFIVDGQTIKQKGTIVWLNEQCVSHLPTGVGIKFDHPLTELSPWIKTQLLAT